MNIKERNIQEMWDSISSLLNEHESDNLLATVESYNEGLSCSYVFVNTYNTRLKCSLVLDYNVKADTIMIHSIRGQHGCVGIVSKPNKLEFVVECMYIALK